MPKLSAATLDKRFACPNCGQSFRTRQGLKGHIQFKHNNKSTLTFDFRDRSSVSTEIKLMLKIKKTAGTSASQILTDVKPYTGWINALMEFQNIGIEPSLQDFKNYLTVSLANSQTARDGTSLTEQEAVAAMKRLDFTLTQLEKLK